MTERIRRVIGTILAEVAREVSTRASSHLRFRPAFEFFLLALASGRIRAGNLGRSSIFVHRSNRTEELADVLAEVVRRPAASPLVPETIVVQGPGMERWLSMALAERLGVWANPDFPFPRHLVERAFAAVLGERAKGAVLFGPEVVSWAVADLLPGCLGREGFEPLASYLAEDLDGRGLLELSWRIADTFDRYSIYRPRMVAAWERGEEGGWQAELWRLVVERLGRRHPAALAPAFVAELGRGEGEIPGLPPRLSLFGVASLPPLFVDCLAALAGRVELHLFLLSPSREFWAEIRSRREILRELGRRGADSREVEEALHLSEGHPLLASLGRLGRDFQQTLEGIDYREGEGDLYRDPGRATMLGTLQGDILALRHRREGSADAPPLPLAPEDTSITVHACHGPRREVEVLHDQLQTLFDEDPSLEPRDVVVMTPDIELYGPLVEAVFDPAGGDRPAIPFRVADRGVRASHEAVEAFERLLDLLVGRFPASEVLDLLALPAVRERFSLGPGDLETVRRWVAETGIRWGVDAVHRAELGQPAVAENTWRFGLERLFLGFAMEGGDRRLFAGTAPYDHVEADDAELLGRFAELLETLFAARRDLGRARPVAGWRRDLGRTIERTLAADEESSPQLQLIRTALEELAEAAASAGFETAVELAALRPRLARILERRQPPRAFLTGGVSVCELLPMRTIPFRVVCLLGLSEGAFPRRAEPLGFDLMARRPLAGDRSAADDDRYLFLEALLSARERLLVTYVGQSQLDGTELPPSVLVDELLDSLAESFVPPMDGEAKDAGEAIRRRLLVRHPLQPWSPRYFDGRDERLFSYSRQNARGAAALLTAPEPPPAFLTAPLPPPEPPEYEPLAVDLDELVAFFRHPARAFLQGRLGLYLGREEEPAEDREPRVVEGLERWRLGSEALARRLGGEDPRLGEALARGRGDLPPGTLGTVAHAELRAEAETLATAAARWTGGTPLDSLEVDHRCEVLSRSLRLTGTVADLWPAARVRIGFGRVAAKRELDLWLRHLALCAFAEDGPATSLLFGRGGKGEGRVIRLEPVAEARGLLEGLLELYLLGQQMPLPFFPEASRAYAAALGEGGAAASARARKKAADVFAPSGRARGEAEDAYVRQAFPGAERELPLAAYPGTEERVGFAALAAEVFAPLLAHRKEGT